MKREHAETVDKLMREYLTKLNESLRVVMDNDSPEAFKTYRSAVAHVMSEVFDRILEPIYAEHPELMPEELKTPAELKASSKPRPPEPQ